MADTIAERCERLRQPVLDMVSTTMMATVEGKELPKLRAQIAAMRAIIDDDRSSIDSEAYLQWHPEALVVLDRMEQAAEAGDGAAAYAAFTDKEIGFYRLGKACEGMPGW